jgi:hypothetical protein
MLSLWLTSLASGIFLIMFLSGCAPSFPSNLREEIPIGKNKEETDEFFARQNNETGHWTSKTVDIYSKDGKLETIHVYEWKSAPGYSVSNKVLKYETTFRDNELISITPRARDIRNEYRNRGNLPESEKEMRRMQECRRMGPFNLGCGY